MTEHEAARRMYSALCTLRDFPGPLDEAKVRELAADTLPKVVAVVAPWDVQKETLF